MTEKCNLSCIGCANLMDYYKKPENLLISDVSKNLLKFLDIITFTFTIKILGGEPLLHKDLHYLITDIFSNEEYTKKFRFLTIVTNGTIIPNKNNLEVISRYKHEVVIDITNYGHENKINNLVKTLEEYEINYFLSSGTEEWYDIGNFEEKRDRSHEYLKSFFKKCEIKYACNTLLHGKYYFCPVQAHGIHLNLYSDDGIYLDLNKEGFGKIKYLKNIEYLDACDYCDWPLYNVVKRKDQINND